ncbi:MAG: shikimate dehydrogenase [Burkholderiales bacterium]|jgi:shikimate dehydrogenase|nr:shikimate dehydrogenase [Burkholderiales bacterium]
MNRFVVIGNPIAHSRSPEIHLAFAKQTGVAISYQRLEAPVTADDSGFSDAVRAFFADGGNGMNVTAPFKDAAFRLASGASERASLAAAANTLVGNQESGTGDQEAVPAGALAGWYADNTDGIGLVRDLTCRLGLPLAGQRLLILGAGGASAGILGPLLDERPSQVVLWNRSSQKARNLGRRFAAAYPGAALTIVSAEDGGNALRDRWAFDLVIHATSLKARLNAPDEAAQTWPWLHSLCAPATFFYDLSYADDEATLFLRWAKECGARWRSDGLGMLVEQAAESFRIWHGCLPETAPVFAALRAGKS